MVKLILLCLSLLFCFIVSEEVSYVKCPDGVSACANDQICCKKGSGYRCCPNNLVCCLDGTYCCNPENGPSLMSLLTIHNRKENGFLEFIEN
jgi:hypothetical protein